MTASFIALLAAAGLAALAIVGFVAWRLLVIRAAPDEWLLRIRGGALAESGIGVLMLRRPGDIFARFSSTLQRVGFQVEALSADRLPVAIRGFVIWSVSDRGDAPFLAFRSLGLANLIDPPADLSHPKHLLTRPQHKAFQQIVGASAQRLISGRELEQLMGEQSAFVQELGERLALDIGARGVHINQVELLEVRPADPELLAALCVRENERIREDAAVVRQETAERIQDRDRERATREAREDADARRDRQAHEARAALELHQQRSQLLDEEHKLKLAAIEAEAALNERERLLEHERALREEARARELQEAELARRERALAFKLHKTRLEAEASRDAALAALAAEAEKPQELRDFELARLNSEALKGALDFKEARWLSIGDSPGASIAALFDQLRGVIGGAGRAA